MGDNSRLASWGPVITLALRSATVDAVSTKRPLAIMGVMKYIVDTLDDDGVPDATARLSGPAMLESTAQDNTAWSGEQEKALTVILNGMPKAVTTPTSVNGITGLVNWLNGEFGANSISGFGGVEFSAKAGAVAGTYILVAKSIPCGNAVQMYVSVDGMGVFTLGLVSAGFGSYTGRAITVPFVSLPDPKGVLDKTVLEEDTITIGVSTGLGTLKTLSRTAAFERHSMQRTPGYTVYGGDCVALSNTDNFAPFRRIAAVDCPVNLTPWNPSNGQSNKLWAAGRWPSVRVYVDSLNYAELTINSPAVPDSPDELIAVASGGAKFSEKYGALYNLGVLTVAQGGANTITYAGGKFTATLSSLTLEKLQTVLDSEDGCLLKGEIVGTGAIVADDYYFLGGVGPQLFDEDGAPAVLLGGKILVKGGALTKQVTMTMLLDAFPEQSFSWPNGTSYADIFADLNAVFGAGTASWVDVGTKGVVKLMGAKEGFPGVVYIGSGTNLDELFYNTAEVEIGVGDATIDAVALTITIDGGLLPDKSILLPGDEITDVDGAPSYTIRAVGSSGGDYVLYLDEIPAFPVDGTKKNTAVLYHVSRLGAGNYVGVPHQGVWNAVETGDAFWDSGAVSAQVASLEEVADTDGFGYGTAALKLSIYYSTSTELVNWYIRAQGIDIEDGGETLTPELLVNAEDEYVQVRQCSVVNYNGVPYFGAGYTTYAGFTGIRQDQTTAYTNKAITISKLSDFDAYGPYDDPRNPVVYGAYRAFASGAGKAKVKMFPVEADDLTGWMAAEKMMMKNRFWMVVPMTTDDSVNTWLGLRIKAAETPSEKRTWCTVLSCVNPTESYPDVLGSAIDGATNEFGTQRVIVIDADKLNIAAALLVAEGHDGKPIDPATVTKDSGIYVQVSGGGSTDTESSYKYLVKEVNTGDNSVTVCDEDDMDTEENAYYQGDTPPNITNANLSILLRGGAITDSEDKLTALQAKAAAFGSRKVVLCPNDGVDVIWDGVPIRVGGYFGVAAMMGYLQIHEIRFPLSGYDTPYTEKVYGTNDTYDDMEGIHSLFFLQNKVDPDNGEEIGGVEVCRSFTTYGPTEKKYHDFTATTSFDAAEIRYRDALKDWRKYNNEEETLNALLFRLSGASDAILTAKEAKQAKVTRVNFAEGDETEVEVFAEVTAFLGLGKVSMYILG